MSIFSKWPEFKSGFNPQNYKINNEKISSIEIFLLQVLVLLPVFDMENIFLCRPSRH